MKLKKIIAIVGPTASGKTGIGVRLARELNGEIISADSRQVYCGLNIGTGKEHFDDVKQWLIDITSSKLALSHLEGGKGKVVKKDDSSIGSVFSVFDWLELARAAVEDIFSRGKVPIVVGGTGLYVQGLIEGFVLEQNPNDKIQMTNKNEVISSHRLRGKKSSILCLVPDEAEDFSSRSKSRCRNDHSNNEIEDLRMKLKVIDPIAYDKIDLNNSHRLIRAIERAEEGLHPVKIKPDFEVLQIGIDLPREELYKKIDKRVEDRFAAGMLEEVIGLIKNGVDVDWLKKLGLEYRIITEFILENCDSPASFCHSGLDPESSNLKISRPDQNQDVEMTTVIMAERLKSLSEYQTMKQALKYRIHAFARRQMTWFRRFPEIVWLDDYEAIKKEVEKFLQSTD